jgi:hypothetical protein
MAYYDTEELDILQSALDIIQNRSEYDLLPLTLEPYFLDYMMAVRLGVMVGDVVPNQLAPAIARMVCWQFNEDHDWVRDTAEVIQIQNIAAIVTGKEVLDENEEPVIQYTVQQLYHVSQFNKPEPPFQFIPF